MIFRHPRALRQLLEHGIVATLRTYRYTPGSRVRIRTPEGSYWGVVEEVLEASEDNLRKLLSISGFSSVSEWVREAVKLHRRRPKWVVVVRLLR